MIKFTYKHITRIIELIESEIERVENRKAKLPVNNFALGSVDSYKAMDTGESFYDEDKKRYDKELEFLMDIRDGFQKELEKMDFTFNVGGKDNQEKYDIKLQDLNRKQ